MPARLRSTLVIALLWAAWSCQPNTAPVSETIAGQEYTVPVTFVDAVLYAGATHYYFERADGERFRVIQSHDAGQPQIANADMLLDPDPDEGPPGPNPAWVGRSVTLHYDALDRVVAVMPAYE